ncbi:hypothetical protein L6R52_40345, partial [Myxococcota bacterium]|nr:hypothetical protein [Myxococcota bacterium]
MGTVSSSLSTLELSPSAVLYYVLYGGTLALHVVLFAYVLAGAGWVALAALRARGGDAVGGPVRSDRLGDAADPIAATLRDWLPFALGLAITAGVAPLLFLQLVQQKAFYTANLLLSHRWMMMLPVLIVGFYLLYLAKSETHGRLSPALKRAIAAVTFLSFAFTGYTWTENHLVTSRAADWPALYASGKMFFGSAESVVRFSVWLFGAVPLMTVLAGWQLRAAE